MTNIQATKLKLPHHWDEKVLGAIAVAITIAMVFERWPGLLYRLVCTETSPWLPICMPHHMPFICLTYVMLIPICASDMPIIL
jgi:hypothetical protein